MDHGSTTSEAPTMSTPSLLPLAAMCLDFARVKRKTMHQDGVTWETDSDHTVMLSIIASAVAARHPELKLDLGLVTQLALVHDLVEVHADDVDTFVITSKEDEADARAMKRAKEHAALGRIAAEHLAWPWVAGTIALYELQDTPEACFVRYMDKVCPRLTNALNRGAAIRARGLGRVEAFERDRYLAAELAEEYPEFAHVCGVYLQAACDEAEAAWHNPVEEIPAPTFDRDWSDVICPKTPDCALPPGHDDTCLTWKDLL